MVMLFNPRLNLVSVVPRYVLSAILVDVFVVGRAEVVGNFVVLA